MNLMVTGCGGFIGSHIAEYLLERGDNVIGVDNLNQYYSVALKYHRLDRLKKFKNFKFYHTDISEREEISKIFKKEKPDKVVSLAAQAGVRYSLSNPDAYIDANIIGFHNILECCRLNEVEHLIYASSSSVYGGTKNIPFKEDNIVDSPLSLYAATKKSNELFAHTYSYLYGLPTTGLRYFTVYGPRGRPDMAPWLFTEAIKNGLPINVYNHGKMMRDFTYIDDIVNATLLALDYNFAETKQNLDETTPISNKTDVYKIYNVGCENPIKLLDFVTALEQCLHIKAKIIFMPMQDGDVENTYANVHRIRDELGFSPTVTFKEGLPKWVDWYNKYTSQ
jgi:UDP-glucuronate 4-epimerase